MTAVKEGGQTMYGAAKEDPWKGHGTNPGPATVLTSSEEASLVVFQG